MRPLNADLVEHAPQIVEVRVRDVFCDRLAEAALVVAGDRVSVLERVHLRVPHAQVRDPGMDERQRRAVAVDLVVDAAARELYVALFAARQLLLLNSSSAWVSA